MSRQTGWLSLLHYSNEMDVLHNSIMHINKMNLFAKYNLKCKIVPYPSFPSQCARFSNLMFTTCHMFTLRTSQTQQAAWFYSEIYYKRILYIQSIHWWWQVRHINQITQFSPLLPSCFSARRRILLKASILSNQPGLFDFTSPSSWRRASSLTHSAREKQESCVRLCPCTLREWEGKRSGAQRVKFNLNTELSLQNFCNPHTATTTRLTFCCLVSRTHQNNLQ